MKESVCPVSVFTGCKHTWVTCNCSWDFRNLQSIHFFPVHGFYLINGNRFRHGNVRLKTDNSSTLTSVGKKKQPNFNSQIYLHFAHFKMKVDWFT